MPRVTHRPYDATAAWVVRILILPSGTFSPMKEDNVPMEKHAARERHVCCHCALTE
ncbi:hypothetical protein XFF6992_370138 [Xanthomonas citri pv. fuscans]|nr:hypothetical protein XFF6992_370138 [Xanthomonas citri pv. fuscans]SOO33864.1 hypothetical protein XFF6994_3260007 [Xanthomonas citri pv. fuscans]